MSLNSNKDADQVSSTSLACQIAHLVPTFVKLQAPSLWGNLLLHLPSLTTNEKNWQRLTMGDNIQEWYIRPEGEAFDLSVYDTYTDYFSIKLHYAGRFTNSPNNKYVDGEFACVDMIPLKSLDFGLKPLVSENDTSSFLGYGHKHKMMYVYVELVETTESSSDEDGEGDSENDSEDGISNANDTIYKEHFVDEVEVNMSAFNFQIDEECKEFANRDLEKERIRAYSIETRRNINFKRNDKRRIRAICKGVVPSMTSKNVFVDKDEVPKEDISRNDKAVNEDAEEDKKCYPWVMYLTKGDKAKWVVKIYKDEHKCLQSRKIKHCTSTFLAKHITDLLIMNPEIPVKAIQEQMHKKFHVVVLKTKAFRAKAKAQVYLKGDVTVQYSLLRDYVSELQRGRGDDGVVVGGVVCGGDGVRMGCGGGLGAAAGGDDGDGLMMVLAWWMWCGVAWQRR
ncbi:hypothetical protein Tco_0565413 [Tanacetum coccineum]